MPATATQSPSEGEDACSGSREGDETNRSGGPAKGEDNRHWSWSSSLRAVTMMGSPKSGGSLSASVYPGGFRFAAYGGVGDADLTLTTRQEQIENMLHP